jgi:hypothetical protein
VNREELKDRLRSALKLLSDGQGFKVSDLHIAYKDKILFSVTGWSQNILLENVTRQSALTELKEIKSLFQKMVEASDELSDFIKNQTN